MNRLSNLFKILFLGVRLGATVSEKLRLTWFILQTKLEHGKGDTTEKFSISCEGKTFDVYFRNNFADVFVLYEAFISQDYAEVTKGQKPSVIFDVGANLGFVSLYFKATFPEVKIFCFEPDPENFAILEKNMAQFSDVKCYQKGIGAKTETRSFFRSKVFHMRNSLVQSDPQDEKISIELISLAEALQLAGVETVDIMKIDVEGAELEIIPAFTEWSHIRTIVGELHPHLIEKSAYEALKTSLESQYYMTYSGEGKKVFIYGTAKQ